MLQGEAHQSGQNMLQISKFENALTIPWICSRFKKPALSLIYPIQEKPSNQFPK